MSLLCWLTGGDNTCGAGLAPGTGDLKVPSVLQMCSCLDRLGMKLYPDALDRKLEIECLLFHPSLKLWYQCHNEVSAMLCGNLGFSNFVIIAQ